MIDGGLVLLTQNTIADVAYYVTPGTLGCPEGLEPCHNIDYYIANSSEFFSSGKSNVTMNFLGGTHTTAVNFEMFGLNRLNIVGLSSNVVIKSTAPQIPTWSIEVNEFHAKNFIVVRLIFSFQVSFLRMSSVIFQGNTEVWLQPPSKDSALVDAELTRCEFKEQSCVKATDINNLSLTDCEFLNVSVQSTDSPLTLYHSTVYLSGTSKFIGSYHSAISAFSSGVTVSGIVDFITNTGINGGALALYSSTLYIDSTANVSFINNTATNVGGAIFVNTGTLLTPNSRFLRLPCFYQNLQPLNYYTFEIFFANNSARSGGSDIYGASLKSDCQVFKNSSLDFDAFKHFHFNTDSLSSVSDIPSRVCVCENGTPQCTNYSSIYMTRTAYPGETITIPVVIVGGDFGTTIGTVYVGFVNQSGSYYSQVVSDITKCTDVNLLLYSPNNVSVMPRKYTMYLSAVPYDDSNRLQFYYTKKDETVKDIEYQIYSFVLHTTPVFLDITFPPCPSGLFLMTKYCYNGVINTYVYSNSSYECKSISISCLSGNTYYYCSCHQELYAIGCNLRLENGNVDISINTGWIGFDNETSSVISSTVCPFDYCFNSESDYYLSSTNVNCYDPYNYGRNFDPRNKSNFDDQCALNRMGTLCGGCREDHSLAIGSSQCIRCSNNNGLALIILFAAAGILLVFLISILNLTVTQGMINGLVVYASIVWSIRSIIIPVDEFDISTTTVFRYYSIFLAWLNLDFGIEACFVKGLDAYWKTWLQFVFPFYTASLFLVGLRFSSKLSKLFGDRSVPTLATLLFLSYTKLLRTIIAALGLAKISVLSDDSSSSNITVWSLDGNVSYGETKHVILVLAALACLLLLWLPFTILLLLMQWFRKMSNSRLSRWITRYKPVFDAFYAPLNDKHHYWFGVLLISIGVILLLTSLTANLSRAVAFINWYIVLIIATVLLFHMNLRQVYRMKSVLVTESLFLINIILLMVGNLNNIGPTMYFTSVSLAYIEFVGIIIWSIFWTLYPKCKRYKSNRKSTSILTEEDRSSETITTTSYVGFRDSILLDTFEDDDK